MSDVQRKRRRSWLTVAETILEQADEPLHSREIAMRAFAEGLMTQKGDTPEHSVQAVIWRDLNTENGRGKNSPFVMLGSGRVHRTYWLKSKIKDKK